jgi:hypothetical protein
MPDDHIPSSEASMTLLNRSGRSTGEATFTGSSGRTIWQVDGSNGENRIRVEGSTSAEA